ncbi:hypothetical membrane protein [Gemmatimonas aurantiaca T-27]|uniref:Hypothetical membrane protein n=1 Tax=Gemmatimonas aurantiaca (strain DSM 14586 / JCM 11422 / NBRC 100505 / T-27) TaxID=379066 RepID=C1AD89_GEMAT|nr:hypothetical protein [Gemmatimonas aurantiaca]BAH40466.1 hypothetical membrane protein [Gemmatimonas aurantiaca T-27]
MTPPTRTFAPPRRTPQDRAFDAVADGGSLVGATITPSTSSRPDAGNMQRTLGNLAVLKARGEAVATGPDVTVPGAATQGGQAAKSAPSAPGTDGDLTPPIDVMAGPPRTAAPAPSATPTATVPAIAPGSPVETPVTRPTAVSAIGEVQREVSQAAASLPKLDAGGYDAAQAAQRALGFRLARTGAAAHGPAQARGGGGGGERAEGDRPREPDPVPSHTKALVEVGKKRLPEAIRYGFSPTPFKRIPVLGSTPLTGEQMLVLKSTAKGQFADALGEEDRRRLADRKVREDAFNAAEKKKLEAEGPKKKGEKDTPAATFVDDGPKTFAEMRQMLLDVPKPPEIADLAKKKENDKATEDAVPKYHEPEPPPPIVFKPAQKEDIGRALAGLRAESDVTANEILSGIRKSVYSSGLIGPVLEDLEPKLGMSHLPAVKNAVDAKIGELQKGAGISDQDLEKAVAARREELRLLREQMAKGATQAQMDTQRVAASKAKKEAAEVAAKKEAADIRAGKVKRAAPKVKLAMDVDSRRQRQLDYVTKDVSDLVVRFKQKGEIRDSVVARMYNDFANAYKFAAQQDEYEIIRKTNDPVSALYGFTPRSAEAGEAQETLDKWLEARLAELESSRKAQKAADDLVIATYQDEARQLGDAKREALRVWAEKRTGKKRTAEQKVADVARDKANQKQADAAAIEQLGRARLAVGVVNDFSLAEAIGAEVQKGADRATIIANLRLNAAQEAILDAYLTPGIPGDDRALSAVIVGTRLRIQNELRGPISADIEASVLTVYGEDAVALDRIGKAQRDSFSARDIAVNVHKALDSLDTDEQAVYSNLANLTKVQAQAIRLAYKLEYKGSTIEGDMKGGTFYGMSGNELRRAQKLMEADQASADALGKRIALKGNEGTWYNAVNPFSTADIEELDKINHGKSLEERQASEDAYNAMYDDALADKLLRVPRDIREEKDEAKRDKRMVDYRKSVFADYRKEGKSKLLADADEELQNDRHRQRFRYSVAGDDESADALGLRDYLPTPAEIRKFDEDMTRAGHPGMGKLLVGDKKKIEAIYERIRTEATARANRERWTQDQLEAEIARRSAKVERAFNHHFGSAYENSAGSALRAAIGVGFSQHAEDRNFVNALADNDQRKADAARIQMEHQGLWASDDVENAVLAKQKQRALEEQRRNMLPLQRVVMARKLADMEKEARDTAYADAKRANLDEATARQRAKEAWTGAKEWEVTQQLQRAVDRSIDKAAQAQALGDMDALRAVFKSDYKLDLDEVVLSDTSGYDNQKAATLLKQGGHLTLGQTMFFAVRGNGTDEEALNALKGHTSEEIDEARAEFRQLALADRWTARGILNRAWSDRPHNDLDMDAEIKDDISGRTGFDVGQMLQGEPKTIREKRARLLEAITWEKEAGPLGDWLAGHQQSVMDADLERLDRTIAMLENPELSAEQRKRYIGYFEQDVTTVHAGIAAHREMLDTWTDRITTVVGFIVGIAVTILTFGAAGLVLAAVIGSIAATASTIALKAAILGAAYGWEDLYTDIAVGVVDAVTAAATAGMGEKLLGVAKRAAAPAASRFAFGRGIQRALQTGGRAAFLNPAEGALAKAIPKSALLESMVKRGGAAKVLAIGMAEGAENLVANIPSALASNVLDDNNYKEGNFLGNILAGTAKQAGMSAGMGLAMKPVMKGTGSVFEAMGRIKDAAFKGQAAPHFGSFEAVRSRYPEITVEEYASLRAMHENEVGLRERAVRESRAEAEESSAARDSAHETERTVASTDRQAVRDDPMVRNENDLVTHRVMDEGQVRDLLPSGLRETLKVEVDPKAPADSIKVERVKRLGVIVDVKLVVGPAARPIDVLRHLNTVHAMQRYVGVTGTLVRAVEYARSWVVKNGPPPFGSKAWEAWHELHKLPSLLEDRFELLRSGQLDADARERIFADIDRIASQIDGHRTTLETRDLTEGVGYIAVNGKVAHPDPPPVASTRPSDPSDRGNPKLPRYAAEHSALHRKFPDATYLQVGAAWVETKIDGTSRTYRVLEVRDKSTNDLIIRREEIRTLDAKGREVDRWVQRGSESNRVGAVGEEAFRLQFEEELGRPNAVRQMLLPNEAIQRGGGQGFDGVVVRFDSSGKATIVLVEVKNYAGRYVPLADITAVGENLNDNLKRLRDQLGTPQGRKDLGLDVKQAREMVAAIDANRLEYELRLGHDTNMGDITSARSSVLADLRETIRTERGLPKDAVIVVRKGESIKAEHLKTAADRLQKLEALDASSTVSRLAGELPSKGSADNVRIARAAVTAQENLGSFVTPPLVAAKGGSSFVDAKQQRFVVHSRSGGMSATKLSEGVIASLKTASRGTRPRAQIVVDETNLSPGERRTVRKHLSALAKSGQKLDLGLVVMVDVSRQTAKRLDLSVPY